MFVKEVQQPCRQNVVIAMRACCIGNYGHESLNTAITFFQKPHMFNYTCSYSITSCNTDAW